MFKWMTTNIFKGPFKLYWGKEKLLLNRKPYKLPQRPFAITHQGLTFCFRRPQEQGARVRIIATDAYGNTIVKTDCVTVEVSFMPRTEIIPPQYVIRCYLTDGTCNPLQIEPRFAVVHSKPIKSKMPA